MKKYQKMSWCFGTYSMHTQKQEISGVWLNKSL